MSAVHPGSSVSQPTDGARHVTRAFQDKNVQLPEGIAIAQVGVDTVSYCWRSTDPTLWDRLTEPLREGTPLEGLDPETGEVVASSGVSKYPGGLVMLDEVVGGGRVGYYPAHRMIFIEGRLAALHAADQGAAGLAPASQLEAASGIAAAAISELLRPATLGTAQATLRRCDAAADIRFGRQDDGLRFLRACGALGLPRLKSKVISHNGETQSVYWITPVKGDVRIRLYDKGLQSKTAPVGELVRIERQYRWRGAKQPAPANIVKRDLGRMWQAELRAWEGCDEIVVAGLDAHARLIMERAEDGTINPSKALRLSGEVLQRGRGYGKAWWVAQGKARQWARHTKELRELGIVLDENGLPGDTGAETLPLGKILRAVRNAWPAPSVATAS
jgi:hypothetical protein